MRTTLDTRLGEVSAIVRGGRGAGTLLGIHGAGHAAEAFDALFTEPALASFDRIAIDLRGRHGSLGAPASSATEAAELAAAALDAAHRGGVRVALGHSFGGAVAIELALALASALDRLVLISSGARLRVRPELLEALEASARSGTPRPRGIGWDPSSDRETIERYEQAFDAVPSASALADWRAADRFDRLADVGRLAVPTLAIGGDADPFTPLKYTEFLASRIPGASALRVEGGSHLAIVERSAELASAIARFVTPT